MEKKTTNNIACRIFKEQILVINQLPEEDRAKVLYLAIMNSFNQFENQNGNQIENQNENAYISLSISLSNISKSILDLLSKNIVFKEYSNNYGGTREKAGRKSKIEGGQVDQQVDCQDGSQDCGQVVDKDIDKDNIKVKDKIKYNHYGELNNVCLTEDDYNKLLSIYPDFKEAVEVLDTWLGTSGGKNKNKNHYAYFKSNSWVWDRIKSKQMERKKTQAELIDEHNLSYIEKIMDEQYNG